MAGMERVMSFPSGVNMQHDKHWRIIFSNVIVTGLQSKYSGSGSNIYDASKISIFIDGPAGIHVLVSDELLNNIKDDSLFAVECQHGRILMKSVYKNEIN